MLFVFTVNYIIAVEFCIKWFSLINLFQLRFQDVNLIFIQTFVLTFIILFFSAARFDDQKVSAKNSSSSGSGINRNQRAR
jgi:hypothetical protein